MKLCEVDSCNAKQDTGYKGFCAPCFGSYTLHRTIVWCRNCGKGRALVRQCDCNG